MIFGNEFTKKTFPQKKAEDYDANEPFPKN